jgi:hypothetical protein
MGLQCLAVDRMLPKEVGVDSVRKRPIGSIPSQLRGQKVLSLLAARSGSCRNGVRNGNAIRLLKSFFRPK